MREYKVSIFRFDAKKDYLPYYKTHTISLSPQATLEDLLSYAKKEDPLFEYPSNFAGKIDGKIVPFSTALSQLNDEFKLDSLYNFRATKDLHVDSEDFAKKFQYFAPFANEDDKKEYEKLIFLNYDNDLLDLNRDYLGGAFFLFAKKMLEKYPEQKPYICEILRDKNNGIALHVQVDDVRANEQINELKKEIIGDSKPLAGAKNICEEYKQKVVNLLGQNPQDALASRTPLHSFTQFKAGLFGEKCECSNKLFGFAKLVKINLSNQNSGASIYNHNKKIALQLAGRVLQEALDNGCDFVVVKSSEDFEMLERHQKEIECEIGRTLQIPVLTAQEVLLLSLGELDKIDLNYHTVNISFL